MHLTTRGAVEGHEIVLKKSNASKPVTTVPFFLAFIYTSILWCNTFISKPFLTFAKHVFTKVYTMLFQITALIALHRMTIANSSIDPMSGRYNCTHGAKCIIHQCFSRVCNIKNVLVDTVCFPIISAGSYPYLM